MYGRLASWGCYWWVLTSASLQVVSNWCSLKVYFSISVQLDVLSGATECVGGSSWTCKLAQLHVSFGCIWWCQEGAVEGNMGVAVGVIKGAIGRIK